MNGKILMSDAVSALEHALTRYREAAVRLAQLERSVRGLEEPSTKATLSCSLLVRSEGECYAEIAVSADIALPLLLAEMQSSQASFDRYTRKLEASRQTLQGTA